MISPIVDNEVRRQFQAKIRDESELPYCAEHEIDVTIEWQMTEHGSLNGRVIVRNIGHRACRVGGKPNVTPVGLDGEPLPAQCIMTLEGRVPGWVVLKLGARAAAPVMWAGWCGDPASGLVRLRWQEGEITVAVDGPAQPKCPDGGQATNLSSSWFMVIDEPWPPRLVSRTTESP